MQTDTCFICACRIIQEDGQPFDPWMLFGDGFPVLRQGHCVVGVLGTDSLIKEVHDALLFTVVDDAEDIM